MLPWPTSDPEYGSFNWLRREVAIRLKYSPDARLLDRIQRAYVDSIIESGVMQFATGVVPAMQPDRDTPPGEGRAIDSIQVEAEKEAKTRAPYRWSFLNKVFQFSTAANKYNYDLPSDFGSFHGEPTTTREGGRIAIVREAHLRQLIASSPASGKPAYCTTQKVSVGGQSESKSEILLYPAPDGIETISVEYGVIPATLDANNPYPPGGREHAETVLAFCFYVLAQRAGEGVDAAISHLRDRMAASIVIDRAASKPTADGVWVEDNGRFNHHYLLRMIGRHLGYGPNPKAWSHQQTQASAECLRRTLRRVYNPPLLPNELYPHEWSFLRPKATLSTKSGQYEYLLPEDFAAMYGDMTHATLGSTLYPPIRLVGEQSIRDLLQRNVSSARPDRAAIRPVPFNKAVGTRYQLLLWPVPDQTYEIDYRYRVNPDSINLLPSSETDFDIHGGDRFSEMFLEAGMLTADEFMGVKRSEHLERFMRAVQAAVGSDRVTASPPGMGYNGDRSELRNSYNSMYDSHDFDENIVTYNGARY